MFKRTAYLAFSVATLGGIAILSSTVAHSQGAGVKNLVWLQGVTPGVSQSGHSNISGTSRASAFIGGGAGLTSLNASSIASGTLSDARLSSNVALKNASNLFSATNQFLGLTRMDGFVGIGTGSGLSFETRFQVNDNIATTGYGGMYVHTASATAKPFYGYGTGGVVKAWTYVNGSDDSWRLNVAGLDRMSVSTNGSMGFNGLAQSYTYTFNTLNGATDGIYLRNGASGANSQLFFDGAGNFGTVTLEGGSDTLVLENDLYTFNISELGHFGFNTTAPTGSEDVTIQSRALGGYGGITVRVNEATTGQPFYGYANGSDYMWTYFDSQTDEWRIYNNGDRFRLNSLGDIGIQAAPIVSANILTETSATSGSKDGVRGFVSGINSPFGVWGLTLSATGTGTGVRGGENSTSAAAYGVFADGNFGASGTKAFVIDHPLDPTNKYLKHYTTESPTPVNAYSGQAITDGNGFAWVDLPDYFAEINTNFRYQLTVVDESDDFVLAKVSKRIKGNRFQIRTNKPNVEVSWEVKADRNDKYVQREGAPAEVDKPEMLRGTYLDPIAWGLSEEEGEHARRERISRAEQLAAQRNNPKQDWSKVQPKPKKAPKSTDKK